MPAAQISTFEEHIGIFSAKFPITSKLDSDTKTAEKRSLGDIAKWEVHILQPQWYMKSAVQLRACKL
jgi:hypothetical protein